MLNGVIDSRAIRKEKVVSRSQSLGSTTSRISAAEAEVTRMCEEMAQHEVHYADYIASQYSFYANHYATQIAQQIQVSLSN